MKKRRIRIILALFAILCAIYGPQFAHYSIFFTNNTLSAPQGIYMRVLGEPEIGNYVVAKLPVDIPEIKGRKGEYLIKKVQGVTGSQYFVTGNKLTINNKDYPITHKSYLPQLPKGFYRVKKDHYLLLNDVFNSLDSRYLGEFPKDAVITRIVLILEYKMIENFLDRIVKRFTGSLKELKSYESI